MVPCIIWHCTFFIPLFTIGTIKESRFQQRIASRDIKYVYPAKVQKESIPWHNFIAPPPPEAEAHSTSTAGVIESTGTCAILQIHFPSDVTWIIFRTADRLTFWAGYLETRLPQPHPDTIMQGTCGFISISYLTLRNIIRRQAHQQIWKIWTYRKIYTVIWYIDSCVFSCCVSLILFVFAYFWNKAILFRLFYHWNKFQLYRRPLESFLLLSTFSSEWCLHLALVHRYKYLVPGPWHECRFCDNLMA